MKAIQFAFEQMGRPRIMQADNAGEFVHGVDEYCKGLGIEVIHSSVAHPQTQGCVERGNGDAKKFLCQVLHAELEKGREECFTWEELKGMRFIHVFFFFLC